MVLVTFLSPFTGHLLSTPTGPSKNETEGLVKQQQDRNRKTKQTVSDAFQDLEGLMAHARQMVALASKLAASQEAKEKEDEFDDMLQNLGIASPVTKEAAGSRYHSMLARQLADFLMKLRSFVDEDINSF